MKDEAEPSALFYRPPCHRADTRHDGEQPCSRLSRTFEGMRMMAAAVTRAIECVHAPVTVKTHVAHIISFKPPNQPTRLVL